MDSIDIFLIAVTGIAAIMGFVKGFIHHLGSIAALVGAVVASRMFGGNVAELFRTENEMLTTVLAYSAVFIITFFVIKTVAHFCSRIVSAVSLGIFDRLAGAFFNAALWLIVISLCANLYIAFVPEHECLLCPESKPWRAAVADLAPNVIGFIRDSVDC